MNDGFLSCDWGTSRFRLRWIRGPQSEVVAEVQSDDGTARLAASHASSAREDAFRNLLVKQLGALQQAAGRDLTGLHVVISGMASASIGWCELPYAQLPFRLDGSDLVWREMGPLAASDDRRTFLISGLQSKTDVMRGEETEVLGAAQILPANTDRAVLILPGTHSKHVGLKGGSIDRFQTYMTGELFEVLRRHSVLRHSLPPGDDAHRDDWKTPECRQAFCDGVRLTAERSLSAALFRVRTRQLLDAGTAAPNQAFLSGCLIGAEIADLSRSASGDTPIYLGARDAIAERYQLACERLDLSDRVTLVPAADVARFSAMGQAVALERILGKAIIRRSKSDE